MGDKMKKILFYTSGIDVGGVEKVLLTILNGLDLNKYDIKLAMNNSNENYFETVIPNKIDYKFMIPKQVIEKTKKYRGKKKNFIYKVLYSYMLWYEKKIAKKNFKKYAKDREILIDFKSGDYLQLVNSFKDKKKITWLHGEIENLVKYRKNKEKFKKNLGKCNKIILICNEMKKEFQGKICGLNDKLEVIYNLFDIEKIRENSENLIEETEETKKLLKEKYILMVSRIDLKAKDFTTLFKAYSLFNKKDEYKLILLGDGKNQDKLILNKEIKKLGLEERVIFLGKRKNPYPWIKNANLLVHSSKTEGFGLVLVEAQILETIIIASDCKVGPKEVLNNGKSGILVKVGDYKEMAQKMDMVLKNNFDKNKYIEEMKKSILRFEKKEVIKKIEKILDNL